MPNETRPKTRLKRALLIIISSALLSVLILLGVAGWRFSRLGATLRPELERTLTQTLGRTVKVDSVRTVGFNQLSIDGLHVTAGGTSASASSIFIPHTSVAVNAAALLFSRSKDPLTQVKGIGVENVDLNIQRAADGSWGMEDVIKKLQELNTTARPQIQIITGKITYKDSQQGVQTIALQGMLAPQVERHYQVDLNATDNQEKSDLLHLTGQYSPENSSVKLQLTGEKIATKTIAAILPADLLEANDDVLVSVQMNVSIGDILHPEFATTELSGDIAISAATIKFPVPVTVNDAHIKLLKTAEKIEAKLQCASLGWQDITMRDIDISLANSGVGEPIIISSIRAETDYGNMIAYDGKMNWDGSLELPFRADSIALGNFSENISGTASLAGIITGTLANPRISATIKAKDGVVYGRHYDTGNGELRFANGKVRLHKMSLRRPGFQLQLVDKAKGYDPFVSDAIVDTVLNVEGASFTEALDLFGIEAVEFPEAVVSGSANIRFAPIGMSLTGKAHLAALEKADYNLYCIDGVDAEFAFAGNTLDVATLSVAMGKTVALASGRIAFPADAPATVDMQMKLEHGRAEDIAPLCASLVEINATGNVEIAGKLQGSMTAPVITGDIAYTGDVALPAIAAPFPNIMRNLTLAAAIDGNGGELRVTLTQCTAELGSAIVGYVPGALAVLGKFTIPGASIANPNAWRWDMAARVANCQLDKTVAYVDNTSGYLRLVTIDDKPLLSGVLCIENTQLQIPANSVERVVCQPFSAFDPALSIMLQLGDGVSALNSGMRFPLRPTPMLLPRVVATTQFSCSNSFLRRNATQLDAQRTSGSWGTVTGTLNYPHIAGNYEVNPDEMSLLMGIIPLGAARGSFNIYPRGTSAL